MSTKITRSTEEKLAIVLEGLKGQSISNAILIR